MQLGHDIVDRGILDCNGRYAGKVDDLVLEVPGASDASNAPCSGPEVVALLSGPMALSQNMSRPVQWLVRSIYRLAGLSDPQPSEVAWDDVASLEVVVHLSIDRAETGWSRLGDAVNRRFITRLPGS